MNRVFVVLLWHMHQPEYRDPATGDYLLPWTRLHALKDYYGMVALLEEFPHVHATFNLTPVLLQQVENYASGNFRESLFELVFKPATNLTPEEGAQLLRWVFLGGEQLVRRFPRFRELRDRCRAVVNSEQARQQLNLNEWIDLQVLSQLAWMDEYYLAQDPLVSALAARGRHFSEEEKEELRKKEIELIGKVVPAYRAAAERGQVELSTTPMYHPILPLLIDTDVAREANPNGRLPRTRFAYPEDARVHVERALALHRRLFGRSPRGMWPAEGSVSLAVAELVAEHGIGWLASDEGVLARSLAAGGETFTPRHVYRPYALDTPRGRVSFVFRDHHLSDLIGFVYAKMKPAEAAADLHRRIRQVTEPLLAAGQDALVPIILDGENAWEYYAENGRPFLREFYRRLQEDSDIEALTVSEAVARWGDIEPLPTLVPGSWINANFDVWIGHTEDHRAWELLAAARSFYARQAGSGQASPEQLQQAYEALLVAESSDWCWWFGPEHQSAQDADFDTLFRKYVTQVYRALGSDPPDELSVSIKRLPVRAAHLRPTSHIQPVIDGTVTNYFEWLGAGLYAPERRSGALHAQRFCLRDLHYGFDERHFYLRVDFFPDALNVESPIDLRVLIKAARELRVQVALQEGAVRELETSLNGTRLDPTDFVEVGLRRIFELRVDRRWLAGDPETPLRLNVSFWEAGLPLDTLPPEGWLEVATTEEAFGWRGV